MVKCKNKFMMKKIFLAVCFVILGITAQSQILISLLLGDKLNSEKLDFGLEGGMNWSNISGFETNNYARFFNMGFYFDIKMKNQWSFYTGVLIKSNIGVDKLTSNDLGFLLHDKVIWDGNYKQIINTFYIPAFAKYNFKNHFYIEAGPEIGLRYNSMIEYTSDAEDVDTRIRYYNKDMLKKIDAGFGAGFGYRLLKGEGWTIGAKYYLGFVDVYKDKSGTKSSSINLKVNIPIGAGEKEPK